MLFGMGNGEVCRVVDLWLCCGCMSVCIVKSVYVSGNGSYVCVYCKIRICVGEWVADVVPGRISGGLCTRQGMDKINTFGVIFRQN